MLTNHKPPMRRRHLISESGHDTRRAIKINRGIIAETGVIPAGLQLIQDTHSFKVIKSSNTVVEDINGNKVPIMRVRGLFQESDKRNANDRIYPRDVLAEACQLIQDDVSNRSVYGEFDHPSDAKIHLDRVSHLLTKIWMEGTRIYGEAEILDNQVHGKALRGLFERKCKVGISSRGVGDMVMHEDSNGAWYEVQPGYTFVTWDAVADPSVKGATLMVMEDLKKRQAAVTEGIQRARKRNLVSQTEYEAMLLEHIDDFFGIKSILPTRKAKQRTFGIAGIQPSASKSKARSRFLG